MVYFFYSLGILAVVLGLVSVFFTNKWVELSHRIALYGTLGTFLYLFQLYVEFSFSQMSQLWQMIMMVAQKGI